MVLEVESPRQRWRQRLGECIGHVVVPIDQHIADNCRTDPLAAKIRRHVEELDSLDLRSGQLQRIGPGVHLAHPGLAHRRIGSVERNALRSGDDGIRVVTHNSYADTGCRKWLQNLDIAVDQRLRTIPPSFERTETLRFLEGRPSPSRP